MYATTKVKVVGIDFLWDCPQYYVSPFGGDCFVGVGATAAEAAEDCLECLAQADFEIDDADAQEIIDAAGEYSANVDDPDYNDEDPCMDGPWWYCAVQVSLDGE
jgi:hypothetical protein